MEKKIIYVVTSGSYSDYGIDAIFSTEELAKKFIGSFKSDGWNEMMIEEWTLDPNEEHLKQNRKPFFLRIDKEGTVSDIELRDGAFGFKEDMKDARVSFTADETWMNLEVWADDELHAVKIAGEKRTWVLANDKWGYKKYFNK